MQKKNVNNESISPIILSTNNYKNKHYSNNKKNTSLPAYKNKKCCSECYSKSLLCLFSCKCLNSNIFYLNEKIYFIKVWASLSKEYGDKKNASLPFKALLNLYSLKKDIINELKCIRLNPNLLLIKSGQRNDLEFYIPQLCNFNLFGEYEQVTRLLCFLCNACYCSSFFAHRVYWFMRSIDINESSFKIEKFFKVLNTVFKSDKLNFKHIISNLYVTGSQKYINYLKDNNLLILYEKNFENLLEGKELQYYKKIKETKEIINNFCDKMLLDSLKNLDNIKNNNFINHNYYDEITKLNGNNDNNIFENKFGNEQQINLDYIYINNYNTENNDIDIIDEDINLKSFYSVINFYDDLCDIGKELLYKNPMNYKEIIIRKITEINKNLPANVYLPFLTDSARNYIIIHIPITEIKIFKTKERVPFMLVFEAVRLDEITYQIYKNRISIPKNKKNTKKIKKNIEKKKKEIKKIIDKIDLEISKPITITKLEENIEKQQKSETNTINTNQNIQTSSYFKDLNNKQSTNLISENEFDQTFNNINIKNNYIENTENTKNIYIPLSPEISFKKNNKLEISKSSPLIDDDHSSEVSYSDEEKEPNSSLSQNNKNIINNKNNININKSPIEEIFGEQYENQKNRLQKNSIFQNFSTFKLFKVIIKTGENLRQEQFATQLISEFKQIFSLYKVDCWLSTYEIISTGKDCGIVEVVPNSLSLNEIKQKTGLSLKNFYIKYFGNEKSKSFHIALKNFIKSLAGYSLVCYFLQIKDRHNGNLLIDSSGHLIHIDFGFMLSNSPGKGIQFENAPFKITNEMLELLGGINSKYFLDFRKRLFSGYLAIYKNYEKILKLNEFMFNGNGRYFPCFEKGTETLDELKQRLIPKEKMSKMEKMNYIDELISLSLNNWTTTCYDKCQYYLQGIFE